MPSPQYYIELDNSTVASFDPSSSTAEGLVFGSTEVKLKGHSILTFALEFECNSLTGYPFVCLHILICLDVLNPGRSVLINNVLTVMTIRTNG